jgi:predicted permease
MALFNRLANLFRREKLRGEIDEELRYHLEARTSDNLARGMSPREARSDALRRFGGQALALENSRDADIFVWVETILQDLRYGIRSLRANPGITAVALISLALAIGANTAIFSIVNAVLLRPLPYKDPERIVMLWVTDTLNGAAEMRASVPNFDDWKARGSTFQDLAAYREADAAFTLNGEPGWIEFAWVYGDFFRLFGRSPVLGRVLSANTADAHQVVLSYRLWQSWFGGSMNAIGRTIHVSGIAFQVIGVMPEDFSFPLKETQLWVPAAALPDWQLRRGERHEGFGAVLGRMRPGVTLEQVRAEMQQINRQLVAEYPKANQERGINIVPLAAQIHGKTVPFMLAVLFGAVLFVLLIACANVANLLLARGAAREREIALRGALGAGRTRIIRQLLTESLLLSCLGGVLALLVAGWSIRALVAIAPPGIARLGESHLDARVLAFSLILSLATGALFGLAPAIRISEKLSNSRQTAGFNSPALRRAFVVVEVALAVVLVTGAGLLIRSFAAVQSVDPGFQTERVLTATLRFDNSLPRARRAALYRETMTRIGQLPGVIAAGGISALFFPGDQPKFGLRAVEGRPAEAHAQWTPMTWSTVSGGYFPALGVPLLRGRLFNDRDTATAPPVVIINETMARRFWPAEDPIGKGIKGFDPRGRNDEWVRVVGVVKDMHSRGLERGPLAQIYEPQAQSYDETENIVVRANISAAVLRDTIRTVNKTAVWSDISTLKDRLREQNASRRFQTLLVSLFAAIALALAGAGIFGMMHFAVSRRTREIGIRMAMGARPANVLRMVMREGLLLAAIGACAGLAGSLVLTRSLRSLLFEIEPGDPLTVSAVSLLLALVALLACYIPARRTIRVDPMIALHCE